MNRPSAFPVTEDMSRSESELKLKLKNLPAQPGIYLFKNAQGKVIYIGKAKNLRNRVRTYFQASRRLDAKTERLVSQVTDFDLLVTDNEIESLILEANLVHENKPRYNVALRDDKHFPYIKITRGPFPRVLIVRRLQKDGATYFGPYTAAGSMRKTYELLTRLFKIRTCNLVLPPPEGKTYKVCLDYHINRCGGPCVNLQSQQEYGELVKSVSMALSGHTRELVSRLTERMQAASEEQQYEEARELRDQIDAIGSVMASQHADIGEILDRDIIAVARQDRIAVAVVMQIREGVLIGRQDFQLSAESEDSDETILESFFTQYYNHQPNLPDDICIPRELASAGLMQRWLAKLKGSKVKIFTPKIGAKQRLVDLAAANARLLLDELLIQKRALNERTSKMVSTLQDELALTFAPRTMVCFDISNTGETDAVGSCVFFENGRPKKSRYRHFRIKGVAGQDDFSMMREVIGRYFHRLNEENIEPPSLTVVDGGKGQLSAALAELKSLGMANQPVIALAKRLEEIYLPGRSQPVTVARSSPALMLLKRIRDEAHRFAITYNRKVRQKRTIKSALDDIPGIGRARRQALLTKFGSVERIRKASIEDLTELRGITEKLAREILRGVAR